MKVNKTQALLYIYDLLIKNGSFLKSDIVGELEINNLTFLRYIQELRAFLLNFNLNVGLFYSSRSKKYFLIKL